MVGYLQIELTRGLFYHAFNFGLTFLTILTLAHAGNTFLLIQISKWSYIFRPYKMMAVFEYIISKAIHNYI